MALLLSELKARWGLANVNEVKALIQRAGFSPDAELTAEQLATLDRMVGGGGQSGNSTLTGSLTQVADAMQNQGKLVGKQAAHCFGQALQESLAVGVVNELNKVAQAIDGNQALTVNVSPSLGGNAANQTLLFGA